MKWFKKYIFEKLNSLYSSSELDYLKRIILEEITQKSFSQLFLIQKELTSTEKEKGKNIVEKLAKNIPIQYVLGRTYFYNLPFFVDENVLIPRPETEELVEWIIEKRKTIGKEKIKILDIGTGSGCIAVSLAKCIPSAELYAMDKFENVLKIAEKNAEYNKVKIETICADILENIKLETTFDIVVSNPPYIPFMEKTQMDKKVTDNEPETALFVPNSTPIIFYEKIADFSLEHLTENGFLFYEIHQNFGNEVKEMLKEKGFKNIKLKKDISSNDRMAFAEKE